MIVIKNFIRDLNFLMIFLNERNRNNILPYIKFSPFICNKIWWNKICQKNLEKIYLSKTKIDFNHLDIPNDFNIDLFLKINKILPYYKIDKIYWINMMFFSEPNIKMFLKIWMHQFFVKYENIININYLSHEDIVLSSWIMFKMVLKIIKENKDNDKFDMVVQNNLILMLLSDYRDILYWIRIKNYIININKINNRLFKIEKILWINKKDLLSLDHISLMKKNRFIKY